jgi:hypothetical protein
MSWAKVEGRRATHPKLRAAGFAAAGLDSILISQAVEDGSDGFVSYATVAGLAAMYGESEWEQLVDRLVEVGRLDLVAGGWMIHDFLDYNPRRSREGQRRGGQRRMEAVERDEKGRVLRAAGPATHPATDPADRPAETAPAGPADPLAKVLVSPGVSSSTSSFPSSCESRSVQHVPVPVSVGDLSLSVVINEGGPQAGDNGGDLDAKRPGDLAAAQQLSLRLLAVVTARDRRYAQAEAAAVVVWALRYLDAKVVDQVIGLAEGWTRPPTTPRAVARALEKRAGSLGISMPPFPRAS